MDAAEGDGCCKGTVCNVKSAPDAIHLWLGPCCVSLPGVHVQRSLHEAGGLRSIIAVCCYWHEPLIPDKDWVPVDK